MYFLSLIYALLGLLFRSYSKHFRVILAFEVLVSVQSNSLMQMSQLRMPLQLVLHWQIFLHEVIIATIVMSCS